MEDASHGAVGQRNTLEGSACPGEGFTRFFTKNWKCTSHTLHWFILLLIKVMLHHSLSLLVFLVLLVWRGYLLWR